MSESVSRPRHDRLEGAPKEEDRYVGRSMDRKEDMRILTGMAEFIHDHVPDDCLEMAFLRSQHAHARINDIDTASAEAHPDCHLVLTIADLKEKYNPLPSELDEFEEWPLADGKVRYVGEPIAVIVASDRYTAEDILDEINVDYERIEAVTDPLQAREDETLVHEGVGSNVGMAEELEAGDVEGAFENADHVVTGEYTWGRNSGVPIETPGVVAEHDPNTDSFDIRSNLQAQTWIGPFIAETLGVPYERVNLHHPDDIGGSYGTKVCMHGYCSLAAMASERVKRPVRYVEDRIEYLQGGDSTQAYEREYRVKLAIDETGVIQGVDIFFVDDFGAYPRYVVGQTIRPLGAATGAYDIENFRYSYELITTNKAPQTAYRGFGIPAHHYAVEMIIDEAAGLLEMEPAEVRKRNLITSDQMPHKLPVKTVYDSGDYPTAFARIREWIAEEERCSGGLLDPADVEEKRREGKYRGVRETLLIEPGAGATTFTDMHARRLQPSDEPMPASDRLKDFESEYLRGNLGMDGSIEVYLAADSAGQGHQTIVSQLIADELGIAPEEVNVGYLDSNDAPHQTGQASSRLAVMLSGAAAGLSDELERSFEAIAASEWGCAMEEVSYGQGAVHRPETNEALELADLALVSEVDQRTTVSYTYEHPVAQHEVFREGIANNVPLHTTAAFNANAPIVEVDIETGEVKILKLYTIRDCGTRINPKIVEGQTYGGILQGIGATLFEEFVYDESGQPLSTTMFDYQLPSIRQMPEIEMDHVETPSPFTETGAKGMGETGMIDMPASIATSINAALEPLGVTVDEIPFTSDKVRRRVRNSETAKRTDER